ncbi:MAG: methylenetetrahydrofolate reductase [Lactobacillales bacterium]|jgi:methylenetetrahydrofolate reductase (NADPH)|nr:methylenetetrahydrofolate reductase [Lactobacillales bacterium]
MRIDELYKQKRAERDYVMSLEIFPPKKDGDDETLIEMVKGLKGHKPDFISVTYGAGASGSRNKTLDVATQIKKEIALPVLHHLTCAANTRDEIEGILSDIGSAGIENILALRGDLQPGQILEYNLASDLIEEIKSKNKFSIGAACYPEGHLTQPGGHENIEHMLKKEIAGADYFISQLFFDNRFFYDMLERAHKERITVPISAGIMPMMSKAQVERMIFMCGASLPSDLIKIISKYENDLVDLRKASLEYAIHQMEDLVANGVDGIHLYAMNHADIANTVFRHFKGGK